MGVVTEAWRASPEAGAALPVGSPTKRVALLALLSVCLLGPAAGCANEPGKDAPVGQRAETTATATSAPPQAPAVPADAFLGVSEAVERQRPSLDPAVLAQVRAAAQPAFDRVVFEFQSAAVPGYHVAYADAGVRDCGSGEETNVQGAAVLAVRLEPAQAHTDEGTVTVTHERQLTLPVVKELQLSCDFEGQVSWALGLAARRPFRVSELAAPARLVVDIQH